VESKTAHFLMLQTLFATDPIPLAWWFWVQFPTCIRWVRAVEDVSRNVLELSLCSDLVGLVHSYA